MTGGKKAAPLPPGHHAPFASQQACREVTVQMQHHTQQMWIPNKHTQKSNLPHQGTHRDVQMMALSVNTHWVQRGETEVQLVHGCYWSHPASWDTCRAK